MKLNTYKTKLSQTNAKIGADLEKKVCETFKQYGFFAHNCLNGLLGQPCDIIAINGKLAILVDCKHIKKGTRFDFSNIQENQYNCFLKAKEYNNIVESGFAIYCEEVNRVYYLPFSLVLANMDYKKVSVECSQLDLFKDQMNEWRQKYEDYNREQNNY